MAIEAGTDDPLTGEAVIINQVYRIAPGYTDGMSIRPSCYCRKSPEPQYEQVFRVTDTYQTFGWYCDECLPKWIGRIFAAMEGS